MRAILSWCAILAVAKLATVAASDWPQWRGPQRDGIAVESPALANEFGKKGPKLLWQSEKVAGGGNGGYASPVIVDGRVYVYANDRYDAPSPKRKFTQRSLVNLGWAVGMAQELRDRMEAAATSDERAKLDQGDVHTWIVDWITANVGPDRNDFHEACYRRLLFGRGGPSAEVLAKAAAIQGQEFESPEKLDEWLKTNVPKEGWQRWMRREVWKGTPMAKDRLLCLDAATGKTVWQTEVPGHNCRYACSATPCIADGRCYLLMSDAHLYCFDAAKGQQLWRTKTEAPTKTSASSVVVQDGVAVLVAGVLTGLDAKTGAVLWTQPKVTGLFASPAYWRTGDKTYLVCCGETDTFCFGPKTGEVLWSVPGGGWSTPAVSGDHLVVFTNHKRSGVVAYKLSAARPVKLWQLEGEDRGASPVIYGGHVYVFGGRYKARARCIQLATGKLMWEEKLPTTELASPVVADGKLFVAISRSFLYMIAATSDAYTLLGKARMPVVGCTSPALVDGRAYVRLRNGVACYDLREVTDGP